MTRLVLCADDAGLAGPLSRRIAALLGAGRLTATSLLACGAAFGEAVSALRDSGVSEAGVHLCLVGGETPITSPESVPTLAPGGRFPGAWPAVAARAAAGLVRRAEVEREWEAQVERVRRAGLAVTHLDSHQHLHLLPAFLPVAIGLAKRLGIPFVRAPRGDDPASAGRPVGAAARARARLLSAFGASARRALARAGLPEPPRVLGLAEAGRMTLARWESLLATLGEGDFEAVVHPGSADAATRARYAWGYSWDEEADALASPALAERLAERGVVRTGFPGLLAAR